MEFFHRWWYTDDEIDPREHFCFALNLSFETPLLKHLKKLKFKDDLLPGDLAKLQRFSELEMLEIGILAFGDHDETLDFPNLRILYVQQIYRPNDKGSYTLNAPFLSAVFFGNLKFS